MGFKNIPSNKLYKYLVGGWLVLKDVESDGLGQRSALANSDDVTLGNIDECGRDVNGNILVPLLKAPILGYELKVISADDDGSLHLVRDNHSLQDTSSDGHVAREWAFLIDV
jgi:hypothetical protein